jgi:hypothetical protein
VSEQAQKLAEVRIVARAKAAIVGVAMTQQISTRHWIAALVVLLAKNTLAVGLSRDQVLEMVGDAYEGFSAGEIHELEVLGDGDVPAAEGTVGESAPAAGGRGARGGRVLQFAAHRVGRGE